MPTTFTPDKTAEIVLLAHQAAVHPVTLVGSGQDVSAKISGRIFLFHGYVEATADTNPGAFLIQARYKAQGSSGAEDWITLAELTARGTTPDTEALTATEPVGETSLAIASSTGFAARDCLYIQDTGTLTDSEWAELRTFVTNSSLTLVDGLTRAKDSADVVWNDASKWVVGIDLRPYQEIRVIWAHEGTTGANGHVKAYLVTHDSDSAP